MFIGKTDFEAETPILWPPDATNWVIWKDPDAGKDWRHEEKGMTENEMVGWHHRLNGHEFGWTPGVGDGQGGLACCSPRGHKELDTTKWLNWTDEEMEGRSREENALRQNYHRKKSLFWWKSLPWDLAQSWGAGGFIFLVEGSSIVPSTQRPADCCPAVFQVWQSHPNRKRE